MGAPTMRVLKFLFLVHCISVVLLIDVRPNASLQDDYNFKCPQAILGFGDSLTDTGELLRAFPWPVLVLSGNEPYGGTFPGHPTGRYGDGKLMIDFIVPNPSCFNTSGLYYITSGGNDVLWPLVLGGSLVQASIGAIKNGIIPEVVSNISAAVTRLYGEIGARQFVVWGISPVGCTPALLTLLQTVPEAGPLDELGCLAGINALAQELNSQLATGIQGLRHNLPDAVVIFVDFYDITLNITTHYGDYGFKEALKACCGSPTGPYGYDPNVQCGMPGANFAVCNKPAEYISWDGVHYTQAFYKLVAEAFLSGQILDPPIPISSLCK